MKKDEVKVGGLYTVKVSDKLVTVRIDGAHSRGGWNATNTATGKRIRIKSAQRLRGQATRAPKTETRETVEAVMADHASAKEPAKPAAKSKRKPKRISALDAAADVLKNAAKPMGAKELIAAMAEQGLWTSPAGKTPHATLYAAIHREIAAKGKNARFVKAGRGLFVSNMEGSDGR